MNNAQIFLLVLVGLLIIVFIVGLFAIKIEPDLKNSFKLFKEDEDEKK